MLVTPPTIGKLLGRPRRWAQRHVVAGDFGPIVERRRRALLVDLRKVEDYTGLNFTPQQIVEAVAGSDRILIVTDREVA